MQITYIPSRANS